MKAMVLLSSWAVTVVGLFVCTSPFVAAQVPGTTKDVPAKLEKRMFTKDTTEAVKEDIRRLGYTFGFGSFDLKVHEEDGTIKGDAMFITKNDGRLSFEHREMTFMNYISPLSGYPHPGYLYHLEHGSASAPGPRQIAYILFGSRRDEYTGKFPIIYYDYEFNPMNDAYYGWRAYEP